MNIKNHPVNKWASRLIEVLQRCGKCVNSNAANDYVNSVIDKQNVEYQVRLNRFNEEGVLEHFKQFESKWKNTLPMNDTVPNVVGGYLGMELFNRWEKEQKDAIVIGILDNCVEEILDAIRPYPIELTQAQMRETLLFIANSKSISDLASLNFGNLFGDR